jgi:catechol 2,3-dioxygenase-like lactoylglutathione lyase family enzyme
MTGLSHVQLRVTDVGASAEWYTSALGLEPFRADPAIGYVALRHPTSGVVIVLTADGSGGWGADTGALDHLAFAVPDGATLAAWADHLTSVGIDHAGVVAAAPGSRRHGGRTGGAPPPHGVTDPVGTVPTVHPITPSPRHPWEASASR